MLTPEELERYDRQIIIPGFGEEGQEKLKRARVFIAGVGGLGCPAALSLAAAGLGTLRIADNGEIETSNLNRQVLHWTKDTGRPKVDSAREKLLSLNPDITVEAFNTTIGEENIEDLLSGCDAVIDALDNMETRYLLNRTAQRLRIPIFHGAVYGFEGRAMTVLPGKTACLNCLYHGLTPKERFPIIGTVPAVIASIQATEAIKYLTGLGELLTDRLLVFDGMALKFLEFSVTRDPECECCGSHTAGAVSK